MKKSLSKTILLKNKKAYHDYEILDKFEAGISLNGDEVKSLRSHQGNLKGSFVDIIQEEAFLNEAHIPRYRHSSSQNYNPTRKRKLLLHKKEIYKIDREISQAGVTAIPLEIYLKGALIKTTIGICRGKKLYDKRADLKKKAQNMEIKRQLKKYQ